jgi:hypothetical protein
MNGTQSTNQQVDPAVVARKVRADLRSAGTWAAGALLIAAGLVLIVFVTTAWAGGGHA